MAHCALREHSANILAVDHRKNEVGSKDRQALVHVRRFEDILRNHTAMTGSQEQPMQIHRRSCSPLTPRCARLTTNTSCKASGQISDQPKHIPWLLCPLRSQSKVVEVGPLKWNDLPALQVYLVCHDSHVLRTRHQLCPKAVRELMNNVTSVRNSNISLVYPVSAAIITPKIHLCGRNQWFTDLSSFSAVAETPGMVS